MANISIAGGTSPTVAVYGKDLGVTAGIGTDSVGSTSVSGTVSLGTGNAALNGTINPSSPGNDTINLGSGSDTIVQIGQATVTSAFTTLMNVGSVAGGALGILGPTGTNAYTDVAGVLGGAQQDVAGVAAGAQQDVAGVLGGVGLDVAGVAGGVGLDVAGVAGGVKLDVATVIGGALEDVGVTTKNAGTDLNGVFTGVKADLGALGGSAGADTPAGAAASHVFAMAGAQQPLANFVSPDQMTVDGYSLSYLQAHHDISSQGGNTYISIDGGKTNIELKGISGLTNSENTHKI